MKSSTRYIGDSDSKEIAFPPGPEFEIYADCETFTYYPDDLELGNLRGTPGYTKILKSCYVVPGLLVGSHRAINKHSNGKRFYQTGDGQMFHQYCTEENGYEPFFISLSMAYSNKHIPMVYFHNASFDITALAAEFKKLDPDLLLYTYNKRENKKFISGAMYSPKYNFKAKFMDTLLYDQTLSVEKMGKSLGEPKIEGVPYSMGNIAARTSNDTIVYVDLEDGEIKSYPLSKYVEYAKRDVDIIRKFDQKRNGIKDWIGRFIINDDEVWEKIKDRVWDWTQAGHSKSLFNYYLKRIGLVSLDHSFRFEMTRELYIDTFRSNMGGFTSYNKDIGKYICAEDEVIKVNDANSLYPHCMSQELPYGELLDYEPNDDYITGLVIVCYKCEWVGNMAFLKSKPISIDRISPEDGKEFPLYIPDGYLTWLLKNNCEIKFKVIDKKYQRSTKEVGRYMDDLFKRRQQLIKERDMHPEKSQEWEAKEIEQKWVKTMMNSVYGKFCERTHIGSSYYTTEDYQYHDYAKKEIIYRSVLTGSYITYKGRFELLKKIKMCVDKGGTVLYCDTDSVMYVCKKTDDETEVFGKDTGWKGEGKCEGEFDIFLNNAVKKKYCLLCKDPKKKPKLALSGINKQFYNAVVKGLKENNEQTIKDLMYIFDSNNGVILKDMKRVSVLNYHFGQVMIYNTDFKFNPRVKEVHCEITVGDGKYQLNKLNG